MQAYRQQWMPAGASKLSMRVKPLWFSTGLGDENETNGLFFVIIIIVRQ